MLYIRPTCKPNQSDMRALLVTSARACVHACVHPVYVACAICSYAHVLMRALIAQLARLCDLISLTETLATRTHDLSFHMVNRAT